MKKFNNFNPMDMINMMQNLQPQNKQQAKNNAPNTSAQAAPQTSGSTAKKTDDNSSIAQNPLDNNPNVMKYIKRHNEIAKRIATASTDNKDK